MKSTTSNIQKQTPKHVAIIMDGNGRWAKEKGKIRTFGHKAGVKAVRASVSFAVKSGVEALTLFAFSSENWKRPAEEVGVLMELFKLVLGSEVKKLHKNNVKLQVIGDTSRFDSKLIKKVQDAEQLTKDNDGLTLNIAANYGGRWDIVNAAQIIADKVKAGELQSSDINEELFTEHTCASNLPAVDLLIRTGGEQRISNFLLWQVAYAELYFSNVYWPDFSEQTFQDAVNDFNLRQRRFGKTGEQVK
ncbi:polyprenyl diphosphate synthase [Paraglaciecola aquimarina]|uniref:Ditrans,polycis-undecaprenyl-diphosphate synthase ((2E,6E)-farnesyl-diphosphate specific) n=1 Tax=Paraglaciecola aquimarina TaxID=1235557 RepID=A0ABU3SXB9_9ALTE|nr:polyprenyl diphosphate synthase [Paraglaciecola aquimarina]MDU0354567.1 polyprenyl diphosphate synthase [Paraglaciecola aquimarina]